MLFIYSFPILISEMSFAFGKVSGREEDVALWGLKSEKLSFSS